MRLGAACGIPLFVQMEREGQPAMSDGSINARMRCDGTVVRVKPDGGEEPLPIPPSCPLTEEGEAAALADLDA